MPSPRLVTLALLPFALAATAAAQSPAQPAPQPKPQVQFSAPAVHDSRTAAPTITAAQLAENAQRALIVAQAAAANNSVCYALRTYEFTPTEPATGATAYKGQSTCVPAHSASAMIVVAKPR
jgi:hypothetical protein